MAGVPTLEKIDRSTLPEPQAPPLATPFQPSMEVGPEENKFSLMERLGLGVKEFSPEVQVARAIAQPLFPPVQGYKAEDQTDLLQGLEGEVRDDVLESLSREEAEWHVTNYKRSTENTRNLMHDGGFTGGAIMLGSMLVSPSTLALGAAETKALLSIPSKASRMKKMGIGAGTMATSGGLMEGTIAAGNPTVDEDDVLYGALISGALGIPMGAIMAKGDNVLDAMRTGTKLDEDEFVAAVAKDAQDVVVDTIDDLDAELLSRTLPRGHGRKLNKRRAKKLAKEMVERGEIAPNKAHLIERAAEVDQTPMSKVLEPTEIEVDVMGRHIEGSELEGMGGDKVLRNADVEAHSKIRANATQADEAGELDYSEFANTRLGKLFTKIGLSDSNSIFKMSDRASTATLKYFNKHFFIDPSGQTGTRVKTAANLKSLYERQALNVTKKMWRTHYRQYAKSKGISPMIDLNTYHGKLVEDWGRELYAEIAEIRKAADNNLPHVPNENPIIREAVELIEKQMAMNLKQAAGAGVKGFEDIVGKAGYLPLVWKGTKVLARSKEMVHYNRLLSKGYQNMGIPEEVADKIAHAVLFRAQSSALGADTNPARLFSKDSREMLDDILSGSNMSDESKADIFARIDSAAEERGKATSARRRTAVDLTVTDDAGRSLMDLVETDVQSLVTRNTMEIAGRSAMARKGIKSDADWVQLRNTLMEDADGADRVKLGHILDGAQDYFLARPRGGGVNKMARRFMDTATLGYLGLVGAAQAAEFANVFAAHGIKSFLEMTPELSKFRKAIRAGKLEDAGVLGEFEVFLGGLFDEHHLFRPEVRIDDAVTMEDSLMLRTFDNIQASAMDKIGYISGMNQIKNYQQQATLVMQTNKVIKKLKAGKLDEATMKRFTDVGWDEKFLAKLKKKIDDGTVTFTDRGHVDALNMDSWSPELIEDFGVGIQNHTNNIIQLGNAGEDAYWMPSTLGAMFTQFRRFPLLATEKQLARQIRMGDQESYMGALYGLAFSYTVTLAKAAMLDINNPAEKKRMDYLTTPMGGINSAIRYHAQAGIFADVFGGTAKLIGLDNMAGRHDVGFTLPSVQAPLAMVNSAGALLRGEVDEAAKQWSRGGIYGNTAPGVMLSNGIRSITK